MIITLQLIRHGRTEPADKHLYCGAWDVDLTNEGISQLESFKALKSYINTSLYFTSGKKRANSTLKILFGDVFYEKIPELAEFNFGEFEGHTHDELVENDVYIKWIEDDSGEFCCPCGENRSIFRNRIREGFLKVLKNAVDSGAADATIVAHGGTIAYFLLDYVNSGMNYYEAMPTHGDGYIAKIDFDGKDFKVLNTLRILRDMR